MTSGTQILQVINLRPQMRISIKLLHTGVGLQIKNICQISTKLTLEVKFLCLWLKRLSLNINF